MSTVKEIEAAAIKSLPPEGLIEFRAWFARFDGDAWDTQIEADVKAGKLDALIAKAKDDYQQGRCTDL